MPNARTHRRVLITRPHRPTAQGGEPPRPKLRPQGELKALNALELRGERGGGVSGLRGSREQIPNEVRAHLPRGPTLKLPPRHRARQALRRELSARELKLSLKASHLIRRGVTARLTRPRSPEGALNARAPSLKRRAALLMEADAIEGLAGRRRR